MKMRSEHLFVGGANPKNVVFEEPSAGLGYIFRVQRKLSGKRSDFGGLRESTFYPRFKQTFFRSGTKKHFFLRFQSSELFSLTHLSIEINKPNILENSQISRWIFHCHISVYRSLQSLPKKTLASKNPVKRHA